MRKKGLSTVITTLIIILLVLVAIIIVWVVVKNIIQKNSNEINLGALTVSLSIKKVDIGASSKDSLSFAIDKFAFLGYGDSATVQISRGVGAGTVSGIKFIFDNGTTQYSETKKEEIKELETKTFSFENYQDKITNIKKVSIAPILKSDSGQETLEGVADIYILGDHLTTCGNWVYFSLIPLAIPVTPSCSNGKPALTVTDNTNSFSGFNKLENSPFSNVLYKATFNLANTEIKSGIGARVRVGFISEDINYNSFLKQNQTQDTIKLYFQPQQAESGANLGFDVMNFDPAASKTAKTTLTGYTIDEISLTFDSISNLPLTNLANWKNTTIFKSPNLSRCDPSTSGLCITALSPDGNEVGYWESLGQVLSEDTLYKFSFNITAGNNPPEIRLRVNNAHGTKSNMINLRPKAGTTTYNLYYETTNNFDDRNISLAFELMNFETGKQNQIVKLNKVEISSSGGGPVNPDVKIQNLIATFNDNPNHPIVDAIDGNSNTYYMACLHQNDHEYNFGNVIADFGETKVLSQINLDFNQGNADYPGTAPCIYNVFVSADNINWNQVYSRQQDSTHKCHPANSFSKAPDVVISLDNSANPIRYIKLDYTTIADGTGWCLALNELGAKGQA